MIGFRNSGPRGGGRTRIPALALLALALLLPALSLIPLGSIWLWQKGYVLYWAGATFVVASLAFLLLQRLMRPLAQPLESEAPDEVPKAIWNARQEQAWTDVLAFARRADTSRLSGTDKLLDLGLETITLVANRMHPETSDPLLRFTLPEVFAVIEQASVGLRDFAEKSLPFGDRVTVAQIMWIYRWRTIIPLVEKGYDIWRLVRLVNPISAATQELRERYTRQIYDIGREHIARRLTEAFVKEVGKAAIDLYGGSLRVRSERLERHMSAATTRDARVAADVAAEPIRIIVVGQSGAGKSSVVNALTGNMEAAVDVVPSTTMATAYRVTREGAPEALIIDMPGLEPGAPGEAALMMAVRDADMVLWVLSATRAARAVDKVALDALRTAIAAEGRAPPPILAALTHIDNLRPFQDWAPPIDLAAPTTVKAQNIRAALDAVARDLVLSPAKLIAVRADGQPYNIDALWASVLEALPEAKRSRLQRCLRDVREERWNWRTVLSQAAGAGRIISRTAFSGEPSS